jgi:DinB superfamily
MQIEVTPTLIDQYRETFEGAVKPGMCWITDGRRESALLGTIEPLTAEQAFAPPVPGGRSVASHLEHLRFTLDVTAERLRGQDPKPDWASSFNVPAASPAAWESLRREVRRAYDDVLAILEARRAVPPQDWPPIHLAGLAALIAHNAYHLGAIRQIARVVRQGRRS